MYFKIAFILLSFTLITILCCAQFMKKNVNKIGIGVDKNSLQINFNNQVRLAGGLPILQNNPFDYVTIQEKKDTFCFEKNAGVVEVQYKMSEKANIISLFLSPNKQQSPNGKDFSGLFFKEMPGFKQGVSLWRYKPWNCWTKPKPISKPADLDEWDVQFFYWQYADGLYGAAIPLSGQGYRTTLGQEKNYFGAKSVSYLDQWHQNNMPQMTIGFGDDPFLLFEELYQEALMQMGKSENRRDLKKYPEIFEYIGWCTWNSSDLGQKLSEKWVLESIDTFTRDKFPLGWVLIDDGWFDQTDQMLNQLMPHPEKFPQGFKSMIHKLKNDHHVREVGVWHAFDGLWNGINPDSPLGKNLANELFSWQSKTRPDLADAPISTYHFVKPESDSLKSFYQKWYDYFQQQGFSFVKVDNQLVVERMCVNNYPIWNLAEQMHQTINESVQKYFNGAIINCMDMTADAYFNFGSTAIARGVEDYFPEETSYNMQRGNAAAHVVQAVYNALYFGQMVYPDFDMFQSHHPDAIFHAIARALNCGPIYLTDAPGPQNLDVLWPLIYSDGRIIRADAPLMPTTDCLFQVQEPRPLKAYSFANGVGLLGIWNCADADQVEGFFSPSDIHGLPGEEFALYEYFSQKLVFASRDEQFPVKLNRMGYQLYFIAPIKHGLAVLGNIEKYNAPKTIQSQEILAMKALINLNEGGKLAIACQNSPTQIEVDGEKHQFAFSDRLLVVDIPIRTSQVRKIEIWF